MSKRKTTRKCRHPFSVEYYRELARTGGEKTKQRHGRDHFSRISQEQGGMVTPLQTLLKTGQDVHDAEASLPPPEEVGTSDLQ